MGRSARWLISLLTVVVVGGLAEFHAHYIGHYPITQMPRFAWLIVFTLLVLTTLYAAGIPDEAARPGEALVRAMGALALSAGLVSLFALVVGEPLLPRFVVFVSVALLAPLASAANALARSAQHRREETDRVLAIVGTEEAEALTGELHRLPERPASLVVALSPAEAHSSAASPRPIADLVRANGVTLLVIDRDAQGDDDVVAQVSELHRRGVRVRTLSLFYDEWLGKLPLSELERISLLFDIHEIHAPGYGRVKRSIDLVVALLALPLLVIAVPFVALANLLANRGPLFYRQERVGKNGEVFTIVKFRTMRPDTGESRWTERGDARVTAFGKVLRSSHVDELPQVLNVLRHELAIVGPRPEQPRYVEELSAEIAFYDVRHLVQPGITGWAQVKYDYGASRKDALEKLQYEFYYLRHQSLGLDLRIMGRTLRSVAIRRGR